jgi:hypothetical protein
VLTRRHLLVLGTAASLLSAANAQTFREKDFSMDIDIKRNGIAIVGDLSAAGAAYSAVVASPKVSVVVFVGDGVKSERS